MLLAVLSIFGGFINIPHWLEPMFAEKPENQTLAWLSAGVGVAGILLAYVFYVAKRGLADSFAKAMNGFYTLVFNKYYVDELYHAVVVRPLVAISRVVLWRGVDAGLIDGTVNGVGARSRGMGSILRLLQSGNIRTYAAWVVLGSILVLIAIGFAGGSR
jgi:NADH-quinone oxidoreductase subunit L